MLSCQGSNLNSSVPETDVLPVTPQDNEGAKVQKQILNKKKIAIFLLLQLNRDTVLWKTGRKEQNYYLEKKK